MLIWDFADWVLSWQVMCSLRTETPAAGCMPHHLQSPRTQQQVIGNLCTESSDTKCMPHDLQITQNTLSNDWSECSKNHNPCYVIIQSVMCLLVITLSPHTKRQKKQKQSKEDRNPSIYDGSLHIPTICNKNSRTDLKYKHYAHLGMARMQWHQNLIRFTMKGLQPLLTSHVAPNF